MDSYSNALNEELKTTTLKKSFIRANEQPLNKNEVRFLNFFFLFFSFFFVCETLCSVWCLQIIGFMINIHQFNLDRKRILVVLDVHLLYRISFG